MSVDTPPALYNVNPLAPKSVCPNALTQTDPWILVLVPLHPISHYVISRMCACLKCAHVCAKICVHKVYQG